MQIRLKEVPRALVVAYAAGVNVWMWGPPSIGKTTTTEEFGRIMQQRVEGFENHYLYVPSCGPTDIQAAMPNPETKQLEFFNNASLPNRYTNPKMKGVLHLGELANGDPTTVKLLQKYVNNEDMNGVLRKPEGLMVLADSNRLEHKAGGSQQFRAFLRRFTHVDVYNEAQDNIDYAAVHDWHPNVQVYMKEFPQYIDNYEEVFNAPPGASTSKASEEGKRGVWSHMGGLEALSRMETSAGEMSGVVPPALILGTLGSGPGSHYIATREMMARLKSVDEVCADPKGVALPDSVSERYAQCLILAMRCTVEQIDPAYTYAKRVQEDLQVMMILRIIRRPNFNFKKSKAYTAWISDTRLTDILAGK